MSVPNRSAYFLVLLLCLPFILQAQTIQSQSQSEEQQRFMQVLGQYRQALQGKSPAPLKCGFPVIAEMNALAAHDHYLRSLLKETVQRPSLPRNHVTSDGRFRIHYTLDNSEGDAVDPISTNPLGVPDYVYEAGLAAERSYKALVDTLGMRPALGDGNVDGPEFDFYILNLRDLYGETGFETPQGQGTASAYIQIDNDFGSQFFTHGLDALRVTVAHEYFHAVQLAYFFRSEDVYFFEISSTWFEDYSYDEVNDYYQYLPGWFRRTHYPLTETEDAHHYGSAIFLHYLTKRLSSAAIVTALWEGIVSQPAIETLKTTLPSFELPLGQAMQEFYAWTFFTRYRAEPLNFFKEGDRYPAVLVNRTIRVPSDEPSYSVSITDSLPALGARFYRFVRTAQELNFFLEAQSPARWGVTTIFEGEPFVYDLVYGEGGTDLSVAANDREDTVVVAVANVGWPPANTFQPTKPLRYELQVRTGERLQLASVLETPFPNPYKPDLDFQGKGIRFPFRLKDRTEVDAVIFREDGLAVKHFDLARLGAGRHAEKLVWNGRDDDNKELGSGVYFLRIRAGELEETTKFVLLRASR